MWGTPYTLEWGGESDFLPCCCTLISWRPGQNSQLEKFLFRPPVCALCLSCLLHVHSELNISKHRPAWESPAPRKKNMTLLQCSMSQWAALASIQGVKSETKTPFTTLSSVISYKSWQYHLQTSFKPVFFSSFLLPMQPYRCPIMSFLDHSSSFLSFLVTSTQAPLQPLSTQLPELSFHL